MILQGESLAPDYQAFLDSKHHRAIDAGRVVNDGEIHPVLFPFQRAVCQWACRKGKAAVFLDTGLGKTFIQLEWARLLGERTLILAPLSVARQTAREAIKIGVKVRYVRSQGEMDGDEHIYITNYEMLDEFDLPKIGAIVLDESSILKSLDGKTRRKLLDRAQEIPYRLCCTATPAPNDETELGSHAAFLGVCSHAEMLAEFFVHANIQEEIQLDTGQIARRKFGNAHGQEWRIKNHARQAFFRWLASWAMVMRTPSDLGFADDGFILPPLLVEPVWVEANIQRTDELFFTGLKGVADRAGVRRQTLPARLAALVPVVAKHDGQWIIWAGLQSEADASERSIPDAVQVKGSDSIEDKVARLEAFQDDQFRVLVTKPKIAGHGMNFQNAQNMAFLGLSDSWESYYQCIRRVWRYGQRHPVRVFIVLSRAEQEIYANVMRKERTAKQLREELLQSMRRFELEEIGGHGDTVTVNGPREIVRGDGWTAIHGDACEELHGLADQSVDLSVYSPPFADLYTYSPSERDLGNSRSWAEFFGHYGFIIREVLRVTKPRRLSCVHTSDIPALAVKDGYIGIRDFPGEVIRAHEKNGWVFVGRVFVQKNPQAQAIRTKSKALLFVQMRKDATHSRPALVDQILIFKKPGQAETPVRPVENGELDNETWISWAHGIWLDIHESDVLRYQNAREADDEKHICPLQLGTIERCIKLYSNPGEMVLTPFMGIGSEAYQAVRYGRRAVGIELKESYYKVAVENLREAQRAYRSGSLFPVASDATRASVVAGGDDGTERMGEYVVGGERS